MGISTHILDTTRGRPAVGVAVKLEHHEGGAWKVIGTGETDADGRCKTLLGALTEPPVGTWRISFDVASYFKAQNTEGFYPSVSIEFLVRNAREHFHVPLLLNPYGYSTYRGS